MPAGASSAASLNAGPNRLFYLGDVKSRVLSFEEKLRLTATPTDVAELCFALRSSRIKAPWIRIRL